MPDGSFMRLLVPYVEGAASATVQAHFANTSSSQLSLGMQHHELGCGCRSGTLS
jgi:hypothetical protein